jgi:hypothetical protein
MAETTTMRRRLADHLESLEAETATELRMFGAALDGVRGPDDGSGQDRTGEAALRTLAALRRPAPARAGLPRVLAERCRSLAVPGFTVESAPDVAHNAAGNVLTFTRADASEGTLEVAAATGEFGGVRWPSSDTFILGLNSAGASLGGMLAIPPHDAGAVLTVSVRLRVEQIFFDGSAGPGTAGSLLHVQRGDGDLPLRGTAVGWCRAGLTLNGAAGGARTAFEFVSEWVNRDGMQSTDRAPGGVVPLSLTVALAPATSALAMFVDVTCFAAAEETEERFRSAFTVFECRNKPVEEITGLYVFPSRLQVAQATARLCELPVLLATA